MSSSTPKKAPKANMDDVHAALQALITQAKKDGMIRASDLNAQLEKMQLTPEKIEDIYDRLDAMNIQVVTADLELDLGDDDLDLGPDDDINLAGLDEEELLETASPCRDYGRLIAAHIRSDADEVFDSERELLEIGRKLNIPVQVSHIGSMAGFGQMEEFLRITDEYRLCGLDVSCDCYPYYAFSTTLGSTTYDDGWMERYGCGYDAVELHRGDIQKGAPRDARVPDRVLCHA